MIKQSRTQPLKVAFLQALLSIAVAFFLVGGEVLRAVTPVSPESEIITEGAAQKEISDPVADSPADPRALTLRVSPDHGYAGQEI